MNSNAFKTKLKKYKAGTLTPEEEELFEDELEKIDAYQNFIESEMGGKISNDDYTSNDESRILRRSQFFAYFRIGIVSLIVSLLLLPTLNFIVKFFDLIP